MIAHPLLKLGKWHHFKLKADGNNFTFWVNEEKILEYDNKVLADGGVGLGLTNYTARFDNFTVTGDTIPDNVAAVDSKAKLATTWAKIKQSK